MYAAMKGSVVDCYICNELYYNDWIPSWFFVMWEEWEEDGFDNVWFYNDDRTEGICLTPGQSVILADKKRNIRHIHIDQFEDLYWEMGEHKAALKQDCVQYRVYKDNTVQLENWRGEIRYMDLNRFLKLFEVSYIPPPVRFYL